MYKNKYTFLLTLSLFGVTSFITADDGPILDDLHQEIRNFFIQRTTDEVIFFNETGRPLPAQFQHYLQAKKPQLYKKLILHEGETDSLKLSAIPNAIKDELSQKGQELNDELGSAYHNKGWSIAGCALGALFFYAGCSQKNDNYADLLCAAAGITSATVGATWLYCNHNKTDKLQQHIKAIHIIEEKWTSCYEEMEKSRVELK